MSDTTEHPALPEQPICVVVCGLPGVGKTTVAEIVADYTGAIHERSDEIRHEMWLDPAYSEQETAMVYDELLRRAEIALDAGNSVVLDATFRDAHYRERAALVAEQYGVPFELLVVTADDDTVRERMSTRDGLSDADYAVHQDISDVFDPVERDAHYIDNNENGSHAAYEQVVDAIDSVETTHAQD